METLNVNLEIQNSGDFIWNLIKNILSATKK